MSWGFLYWLDTVWQDTRFACRLIARHRWISASVVTTLTIGIALNVSVFSLLNAALLRPWVKTDPETFVSVIPRYSGRYPLRYSDYGSMSQPDYVRFRDSATSIESLAAYRLVTVTLSGAEAGSLRGGLISCNLFDVIQPGSAVVGRFLEPRECTTPMEPAIAVLSETAWRTRFGADPGIVGRVIHLNRVPLTVVGVAPTLTLSGFNAEADVWVPYTMLGRLRPADEYFSAEDARWLTVVGRRRPEYSLDQVRQELGLHARAADARVPGRLTTLVVTDGSLVGDPEMRARAPLIFSLTLGSTALLLVLACVNVTTLLLSRSAARQREVAVRLSLGASRLRLVRQCLTESLVLAGMATAVSWLIAQRAPAALWHSVMSSAPPFELTPDRRVLLYSLAVALVAGLVAGVSPAVESLRPRLAESLKAGGAGLTTGRRRSKLRSLLVAAQVALSLLLVVQVGLFARAQMRFFSYDPGFETRQVLSVTLASVVAGFAPPASFYQELESRVKALPGVSHVSYASLVPWSGRNSTEITDVDGKPVPATRDNRRDPARRVVSPEYFAALGISVSRGRTLDRHDRPTPGGAVPTVISESMARRYWPGQDPVGHTFSISARHEVVGVAPDVQSVMLMRDDGPFYYVPLDVQQSRPAYMLVRVSGDTDAAATAIQRVVRHLDPQMASNAGTLQSIVDRQSNRLRPLMIHGAIGGSLALLLALTGVYAVVSFSASQRIREIGIRMALGAQRRDVVSLVLRSGVAPVCLGLTIGVGLALAASAGTDAILFGVSPRDPVILTAVPLLLFAAALVAIWIPARRAAALDPLSSLRHE